MNAYETMEIRAIIVSYGHMYMSVLLSLRTSLCFSMRKQVLKTLTVMNPGRFGPIPVQSGRFGPGRFGPISGVSRFGPTGPNFGPISKEGRFGPI